MNIINCSFRALCRDAFVAKKARRNVFDDLPKKWWPELPPQKIDPFTEDERDEILAYYLKHRSFRAYAFCHFRFWTGTRPSEATFLKWGSVELTGGIVGKFRIVWIESSGQRGQPQNVQIGSHGRSIAERGGSAQ